MDVRLVPPIDFLRSRSSFKLIHRISLPILVSIDLLCTYFIFSRNFLKLIKFIIFQILSVVRKLMSNGLCSHYFTFFSRWQFFIWYVKKFDILSYYSFLFKLKGLFFELFLLNIFISLFLNIYLIKIYFYGMIWG